MSESLGVATSWDPAVYLRYGDERLRPALDLLGRIDADAPARVVDLGCGPGNVTAILKRRWGSADELGVDGSAAMLEPGQYWDMLRPVCATLDIWETIYLHALTGENAAVQWASGTSLRPFLDPLPEGLRAQFLAAYSVAVAPHYPRRADGTTLLPFRRLFIVARAR